MQTTVLMFRFEGVYDTGDLAKYIGDQLGVKLMAEKPGDEVHGHLNVAMNVSEKYPDGYTQLQIHFNNYEESPNWDKKTKEGHQSHLKPYLPSESDYTKLQEAFEKLFNNDEDAIRQLTRDEIAKILN